MFKMRIHLWLLLAWLLVGAGAASAQRMALKTNLLYDATTTPNLGLELALGKRWTGQLFYGLNPWQFDDDKKLRHWSLMPEVRYWFCSRFSGHFVGVHALGGQFNLSGIDMPSFGVPFSALDDVKHHRYEGYYLGAGLTYGYQWILSRHWNLGVSLGLGYVYLDYTRYQCHHCGYKESDGNSHYLGPTKEALSLIYVF